ncbi:MAG: indolepyruvate ferredoxin oxidoreductase subunit alpha [Promethearchaeota archaeon]
MKIKENLCIGCGQCVIVCPVNAIQIENKKAKIDRDLCVECHVCYRDAECPVNAIKMERLKWPRIIRSVFSDVIATHKVTGIPGRGTEEMKTNDVTDRYKYDEIGISIEIGRPGMGTLLKNVELFTKRLVKLGVEFEKDSPITVLIDEKTGKLNEELQNERVLSAIIEFKISQEKLNDVLEIIKTVDKQIDTVFSVGLITRFNEDGSLPLLDQISKQGFEIEPNAKINLGLGKKQF